MLNPDDRLDTHSRLPCFPLILPALFVSAIVLISPLHARIMIPGSIFPSLSNEQSNDIDVRPLRLLESVPSLRAVRVEIGSVAFASLLDGPVERRVEFPLPEGDGVTLILRRFDVVSPSTRFVVMSTNGPIAANRPKVVLFRGHALHQPTSRAYLSFAEDGAGNGTVVLNDGRRFVLSTDRTSDHGSSRKRLLVHQSLGGGGVPESVEICRLQQPDSIARATPKPSLQRVPVRPADRSAALLGAPAMAFVAVDADQTYVQLFNGDDTAAMTYIVQLIGAVSDIYIRDLDVKLVLDFVRTWPMGGEPFAATDLGGFADYWINNEDTTGLNLIHMFSARRDTSYGGIAFLTDPCSGSAFAISAYLNGGFPMPVVGPDLGNWDLTVVAHEMGHNMGTGHTHDSYSPPIDDCGSLGIWSRSDIMSYCHTTPGGMLNIDPRFHSRVQEVIAASVTAGGCLQPDCNDNNVHDADDIASLFSTDANANGIPDECEDCNGNSILDSVEITGGASDANGNGILDTCEPDCNGNLLPDEFEITLGFVADANGNLIPDNCEPDCDDSGVADHVEISLGAQPDLDRDQVPDDCQDCNVNGVTDYIDVDREYNWFLATGADSVREFHRASGVAVRNLGLGTLDNPLDLTFGPDRQLYVACFDDDLVARVNVDDGTISTFVPAGSGGLDGPSGLAFGPNGDLFVTSRFTSSVLQFNGMTGALVGAFVTGGGLTGPQGLIFGPDGHLYVGGSDNTVRRYNGATGASMGVFVSAGSGSLNGPRGMAFNSNGQLLIASFTNNRVLEYHANGTFSRIFNDAVTPTGAYGVRVGPNGNVFVVRNTGTIRILEYDVTTGRYVRAFIRGDVDLIAPTGLAFRPGSENDCNGNFTPDVCETDTDGDGVIDECDTCPKLSVPTITLQPVSTTACLGEPAEFSVTAVGEGPLSYQWRHEGDDLLGETSATLLIPASGLSHVGSYDVIVSDGCDSVTSDPAELAVLTDTFCDDANLCTDDFCLSGTCQHDANSSTCDDGNACTVNDICQETFCGGEPIIILHGDVAPPGGNGVIDVDDISCVLDGFAELALCAGADLFPCRANGVVDVDDIAAVLDAFAGTPSCPDPCPP